MDAPVRLLSKYAAGHRLRWPSADIVLVQSHPSFIWTSEEKRDDTLKPLANYLIANVYRDTSSGILLHVLSNGGAFQLVVLSRVLASMVSKSKDIDRGRQIRLATIIDSAPGDGEYSSLLTTLTTGVQSPAVKTFMTLPCSIFYLAVRLRRTVLGQENLFNFLRSSLLTQDLLPLADSHAPRLYIYSTTDAMVPAVSVEEHIAAVKKSAAFDVAVEKFIGSPHVLHERQDPERYWKAVRSVWDTSLPLRARL
ncbi:hypothetical protein C8R43DRAFT_75210 [Mycena crocata]|nr:hypothetical protein C8R43DRAFT_75210 [Mycena crocata]